MEAQSLHENSEGQMKIGQIKPSLKEPSDSRTDRSTDSPKGADGWLQDAKCRGCILHLFSGPMDRPDGLAAKLREMGWSCTEMDVVNGEANDLTNDQVWQELKVKLRKGAFDGLIAGPPCGTFTNARQHDGLGPKPLRGAFGADRYGFAHLKGSDKEKVREGTLLAQRTAEAVTIMDEQQRPSITEQPLWKKSQNKVSMFNLDEFQPFVNDENFEFITIAQCEYGAKTNKPTTLMLGRVRHYEAKGNCNHSKQLWIKPSTGDQLWAAHPPLKGKEWHIPAEDWDESMLRSDREIYERDKNMPYLTSGAQAYPECFNAWLAKTITDNCTLDHDGEAKGTPLKRRLDQEMDVTVRTKVKMTAPLRGLNNTPVEPGDNHWGGMRNPKKISRERPGYRSGIHQLLQRCLDEQPNLESTCLQAIGSEDDGAGPSTTELDGVAELLHAALDGIQCENEGGLHTKLRATLIWKVARYLGDPDADEIHRWLTQGAPAGISEQIYDPGEVFPPEDCDRTEVALEHTDPWQHSNYSSVDADEMSAPEIERLIATGFVKAYESYDKFEDWLGGKPHFSKLGMITKEKEGRIKRRLILDCRESGVNERAAKGGKLILPRISDTVDDALYLMKNCGEDQSIEWLILDFTDWFFNIPLHPSERRNFAMSYKGTFIAYLTQAQGSVNAPLICGRVAALLSRMTQALFNDGRLRLQLYVDDPIICCRGNDQERSRAMALIILFWATLGVRLAYKKASRGTQVTWIGAQLTALEQSTPRSRIEVRAKEEIIKDLSEMTRSHLQENLCSIKNYQTYVGKLNHVAGIVEVLRPFMADLYGVLYNKGNTKAPKNCVWTKQWRHITLWIQAFFNNESKDLYREYRLWTYFGKGINVEVVTDASPWGLGGYIVIGGKIMAYYTSPITSDDEKLLNIQIGEASAQQVAEALAILVALKLWHKVWRKHMIRLCMKSDSISALTLISKLRVKYQSVGLTLIGRELALLFGSCCYKPQSLQHIPGLSNDYADALSRQHQPGNQKTVPEAFRNAAKMTPPRRSQTYYQTYVTATQSSQ